MEGRIQGSFPGGPSRKGPAQQRSGPPRLSRVSEIEERKARRSVAHSHRRRTRRLLVGFVLVLALAGVVGSGVGRGSHRTQEQLTAAQQQSRVRDFDISKEVNRTLLNLWKMEDVEAVRNRGRSR